jgi:hypothetical protein
VLNTLQSSIVSRAEWRGARIERAGLLGLDTSATYSDRGYALLRVIETRLQY